MLNDVVSIAFAASAFSPRGLPQGRLQLRRRAAEREAPQDDREKHEHSGLLRGGKKRCGDYEQGHACQGEACEVRGR